MSKISIIVPVYNAEDTIERCIESLISQTFTDIEIILVNDGSIDKSGYICNKYASIDQRIIVINKKNEGVSIARNTGIDTANSNLVMFVDSDDYIKIDTCEKLYNTLNNENYDIAMCGYERIFTFDGCERKKIKINPDIKSIRSINEYKENWPNLFEKSLLNAPWGKLYKLDYIKNNNIKFEEDIYCGEDLIFNLNILKDVYKIGIINESLYIYECSEKESLTTKYDINKYMNDRMLYNFTLNYLKYINILELCKHSVAKIYMRSCFRTFEQIILTKNKLTKIDKKNIIYNICNCRESIDAINCKKNMDLENIIYNIILKTKSYLIVSLFTKLRYYFKNLVRKGLKC